MVPVSVVPLRIVIRGNNSITGNNQPLIVVDGVPIDNFSGGTDDYWGNGNVDKGSGISDISQMISRYVRIERPGSCGVVW